MFKNKKFYFSIGGLNSGVMKLGITFKNNSYFIYFIYIVGDAIDEDLNAQDLTVLGIANRKRIYGTYSDMKIRSDPNPNKENENALNLNHSAFIIVNNEKGTGEEIIFRAALENYLKNFFKALIVLIVVEGGFGTLLTIHSAIHSKTPIILIAVRKY